LTAIHCKLPFSQTNSLWLLGAKVYCICIIGSIVVIAEFIFISSKKQIYRDFS